MNRELVSTECNICGSRETAEVCEKNGLNVVRCAGCGLVYVNPRPSDYYLAKEIYTEAYFNAEKGYGIEDAFGRSGPESRRRAISILDLIEQRVPLGELLDVGCSAGYFLDVARARGWKTRGVEISDFAASFAREKLGLDVITGDFIKTDLPPDAFDAVLMMDLIEHLTSPRAGLEKAWHALKPGGLLAVETPNFSSAPAKALGADWGLIEPEHHLFYFTPDTLRRLLSETGFDIKLLEFPRWGLADLFMSAGSFRRAGLPVGDREKKLVRRYLRAPRDAARAAANLADSLFLSKIFGRRNGVVIRIITEKI